MRLKFIALAAAVSGAAIATPALANEGRVEARGGIAWANGDSEAIAGVAAGYDWDMGESGFVGLEASADKVLADGADDIVLGGTVRGGVKLNEKGKLFAAGGYTWSDSADGFHLGAGYQHKLSDSAYLKVEYRRFFGDLDELNVAALGVGFAF